VEIKDESQQKFFSISKRPLRQFNGKRTNCVIEVIVIKVGMGDNCITSMMVSGGSTIRVPPPPPKKRRRKHIF
jgi:hypothetical protein